MKKILFGAVGGAWGGALVGLSEAILVTATGQPEELWLFPFGLVSYGVFGLAAGLGVGVLLVLAAMALDRLPNAMGLGAALAFLPLAFAISRYHVMQRVFREGVALLSATGIAVHLGILLGAVLVAGLLYVLFGRLGREDRRGVGVAVALPAAVGIAAIVAMVSGTGAESTVSRHSDASAVGRPNVILIVVDTLRADAIGTAELEGGGVGRLQRDGVTFPRAYAQASWTRPSTATMLTSLYPSQHGAVHKTSLLSRRVTTLAEAFRDEGYWTAGFVSNINLAPIFGFEQGFGEYSYLEPSFYFGATDSATRLAIYKGLRVLREKLFRNTIYFQNYYQDAQIVGGAVLEWLAESPPTPFFLLAHYMDPHDPYFEIPYSGRGIARVTNQNPDPADADEMRGLYREGIGYFEEELTKLLADLDARGLYENSVIVLTSDHGEEFQDHGGWWHGTTLYEEQVLVPLIIKPAGVPRGTVDERLAELVDLGPTLMAAAGLPVPSAFRGMDLFGTEKKSLVYAEEDHEGNRIETIRDERWKLIVANPDNPRGLSPIELYDLAADPREKNNLAKSQPNKVQEMMRALEAKRAEARSRY